MQHHDAHLRRMYDDYEHLSKVGLGHEMQKMKQAKVEERQRAMASVYESNIFSKER